MDSSWKLVQPRNRGTAATVSASRRTPPATQGSGPTSRPGASSTDDRRRRAARHSQDVRSQRAADERARKTAAAQQTAIEVARASREAHADALLHAEQARAPDVAHLLVGNREASPSTNVEIPPFSSASRKAITSAPLNVCPATITTRVGDTAPAAPAFLVT
jgi:hypothetical protein